MKKTLIGYRIDGTEIYKSEGIGCACLLKCKKCGKILDTMCCQDDIYCPKCAAEMGYVNNENFKEKKKWNTRKRRKTYLSM